MPRFGFPASREKGQDAETGKAPLPPTAPVAAARGQSWSTPRPTPLPYPVRRNAVAPFVVDPRGCTLRECLQTKKKRKLTQGNNVGRVALPRLRKRREELQEAILNRFDRGRATARRVEREPRHLAVPARAPASDAAAGAAGGPMRRSQTRTPAAHAAAPSEAPSPSAATPRALAAIA